MFVTDVSASSELFEQLVSAGTKYLNQNLDQDLSIDFVDGHRENKESNESHAENGVENENIDDDRELNSTEMTPLMRDIQNRFEASYESCRSAVKLLAQLQKDTKDVSFFACQCRELQSCICLLEHRLVAEKAKNQEAEQKLELLKKQLKIMDRKLSLSTNAEPMSLEEELQEDRIQTETIVNENTESKVDQIEKKAESPEVKFIIAKKKKKAKLMIYLNCL